MIWTRQEKQRKVFLPSSPTVVDEVFEFNVQCVISATTVSDCCIADSISSEDNNIDRVGKYPTVLANNFEPGQDILEIIFTVDQTTSCCAFLCGRDRARFATGVIDDTLFNIATSLLDIVSVEVAYRNIFGVASLHTKKRREEVAGENILQI